MQRITSVLVVILDKNNGSSLELLQKLPNHQQVTRKGIFPDAELAGFDAKVKSSSASSKASSAERRVKVRAGGNTI